MSEGVLELKVKGSDVEILESVLCFAKQVDVETAFVQLALFALAKSMSFDDLVYYKSLLEVRE